MTTPHHSLLTAHPYQANEKLEVRSPYDNSLIATVDLAGEDLIENSLKTAYSLYKNRKAWLPTPKRIEILQNLITLMTQQQDALALQAAREGGKPLMDSKVEVARAIDGVRICIETLRTQAGQVIPMNVSAASAHRIAFTQKEPIGVVVAISAFNHPVNLIIHQVAVAVAAGCPVIVKPASKTPLSCLSLVKMIHEAGLPKEWCQALVIKDNPLATKLACDARVGFLTFIGSAKVGWALRSQLAPGTRCSLEHGGVAPVFIAEDADVQAALPLLCKGGFYHAGQVCVSVQKIFVHQSRVEEVAQGLTKLAQQLKVGDPSLADTEVGPIISAVELARIDEWVQAAVKAGANLLCGGKKISTSCYAPTVLLNPARDASVSKQEIFGPVVCIYSYEHLDEVIEAANALPYAFQAAVFTENINTVLHVHQNLAAATIMLNDHTAFRVDGMPFAGLQHSGLGVGGIPYAIHDMQVEKLLVIKSAEII